MRTATEDMETTINFCRIEGGVSVWTSDTTMYTKFDRLCRDAPECYQCRDIARDREGDIISKTYHITDKSLLSFRTKKQRQNLTEAQRMERAERLRAMRATRHNSLL